MKSEICEICHKKSSFNGYVWLSDNGKHIDLYLCRSHYMKWCKSKEWKKINVKYKNAGPTTKKWYDKYDKLQKAFDRWFEEELKKEKN